MTYSVPITYLSWTTLVVHNRDRLKILIERTKNESSKLPSSLSNFIKILPEYLLIVFKYSMIFWSITQMFSKFSALCEKLRFLHLLSIIIIIIIILVWKGYSQINTTYIHINYRTIFKMFKSSAVAFQKSCFLMRIQDIDQSSFFRVRLIMKLYKHGPLSTIRTLPMVNQSH